MVSGGFRRFFVHFFWRKMYIPGSKKICQQYLISVIKFLPGDVLIHNNFKNESKKNGILQHGLRVKSIFNENMSKTRPKRVYSEEAKSSYLILTSSEIWWEKLRGRVKRFRDSDFFQFCHPLFPWHASKLFVEKSKIVTESKLKIAPFVPNFFHSFELNVLSI